MAPLRLTHALKQALSSHARIVAVTGGEHPSSLQFDNLQGERHFLALNQYSHHKLVMMATMRELARRWTGTGGSINVCYPGQAANTMTQSVKAADMPLAMRWLFPVFKWMTREDGGKSAIKAARSTVYLASSDVVESITGQYFDSKCRSKAWELVHAQGFLSSH